MPVKNNDTILVHYTGALNDGSVFDSSRDRAPLEAALGENMLIPGFENALIGMEIGGKKTVVIPPADAYGERLDTLIFSLPRADVPGHIRPEPGVMVNLTMENGEEFEALITEVSDTEITVDANHPLAGETLTFDLELVDIRTK
ncbi:MAG: peptidylprolyl isomerase [Deltaproteobacteria bacterium]|nr:peptidylprolyl isomerase [Deltaproteobacteria bacterium]